MACFMYNQTISVGLMQVKCERNLKYFTTFNVTIANNTISADMELIEILKNGFRAHLDIQLRLSNGNKFQSLLQNDADFCQMLSAVKDSLFKRWYKSILKNSNFMENCPIPIGHYYLKAYHFDMSLIPSYLLNGDYRIHGLGYYGKYRTKRQIVILECVMDGTMKKN
ncbi:uncharacterized protein Dwil_GK19261 [Drosophila willistoni]|uniref:MD-2-related lipid-recognition domain-containing protein n=2 Tax=Drosophila willistoni TaxID=7260 RepID=B4MM96_DROWI|nr:uncharacterized protein Dwil_GK19261 [Drosophila willistoni]